MIAGEPCIILSGCDRGAAKTGSRAKDNQGKGKSPLGGPAAPVVPPIPAGSEAEGQRMARVCADRLLNFGAGGGVGVFVISLCLAGRAFDGSLKDRFAENRSERGGAVGRMVRRRIE